MNGKFRAILSAALYFYAALCGLFIYSWPLNKYEWILDEPDAVANGLTFCSLPIDHNAESSALLPFLSIVVYVIGAGILTVNRRKPHPTLIIALILFLLWVGKFFLLAPHC